MFKAKKQEKPKSPSYCIRDGVAKEVMLIS